MERRHQTLNNRILQENDFIKGELEAAIAAFFDHYNNNLNHESIGNFTQAHDYPGRGETSLAQRWKTHQNPNHPKQPPGPSASGGIT